MESIVGDIFGLIHLISSVAALIFGTIILTITKGTKTHKKIGYGYVMSMIVLLVTSFMIYRLFNAFGIFHYSALISLTTLILGMIPAIRRKSPKWKYFHFTFMYWSVIGLYAALVSELMVRIPQTPFFGIVGASVGGIMLIGGVSFAINKRKWKEQFK